MRELKISDWIKMQTVLQIPNKALTLKIWIKISWAEQKSRISSETVTGQTSAC